MPIWIHRPQEREGTYRFSGTFYVTQGVLSIVSPKVIIAIHCEIQMMVQEKGGIDYFQVFENDIGEKLYFIDQCSPEMMQDESFRPEYNYCTLLRSDEY